MVFESLVADLLNKYLGQYVKDLDASQLKIGIWGGRKNYSLIFMRLFESQMISNNLVHIRIFLILLFLTG